MTNSTTTMAADARLQNPKQPFKMPVSPAFIAGVLMILGIFILSFARGELGQIGPDNDDLMRLVQIRDVLAGQGWFDTNQYRLGLSAGTDMHWSRLPDIPVLLLTYFFDIFTSQDTALKIAFTIWPPLSAGILIFAAVKAAQYWDAHSRPVGAVTAPSSGPNYTVIFTLVLLAFFATVFYRFEPGAIDHHNVQMGLIALGVAFALDPKYRFTTGLIAGACVALSVSVGVEVYAFVATICAFVALNWLVMGDVSKRATQGFGLGLSGALALAFFGTIAPDEYGRIQCDSLSLITLCAGAVGGLGLMAVASAPKMESVKTRAMGLIGLGALCLIVLSRQAPECLANPLNSLPDDVERLWLNNISEAQPITSKGGKIFAMAPMMLGAPLVAFILLLRTLYKDRRWNGHVLIIMLLTVSFGLIVYQVRFFPFAYVFAIVPLAAWTGRIYGTGRARVLAHKAAVTDTPKDGPKDASEGDEDAKPSEPLNVAYIAALALSIPYMWMIPGLFLTPGNNAAVETATKKASCYSEDVMAALAGLPAGVVSATSNGGGPILKDTPHRAISGNYHRNIAGISMQIKIATSAPSQSQALLQEAGVDYLHFCRTTNETEIMVNENKDGLFGVLMDGTVPPFLVPAMDDLEDGAVSIYRVVTP